MDSVPPLDVRTERFDRVFFFILGLTGLIISLVEIPSPTGEISILFDIPFLFIGIFIPLYVGYFGGAIERESIKRRVRGWIYYIVGMSAYFSLIASSSMKNMSEKQLIFGVISILGLVIAYLFIKWSKKTFGICGTACQYSFSGTAFSSFCIAFVSQLIVNLSIDFQGKNSMELFFNSPEVLFWAWLILTILFVVSVFEKTSKAALDAEIEIPPPKRLRWLLNSFVIKGVAFGYDLFDYLICTCPKLWFLWTQSFTFCIISSFFWVLGFILISQIMFVVACLLSATGCFSVYWAEKPTFENIGKINSNVFNPSLLIFCVTFLMVFTKSLETGFLIFLILASWYLTSKRR
jgi:hypothetical protein